MPTSRSTQFENRTWMIAALLACVVAAAFEGVAVTTAMPEAAKSLGDSQLYAWSFTAFMIGSVTANGIAGRFADRFGPVRPLLCGLAIFFLALIAAGFAPSMIVLIAIRVCQGFGVGCLSLSLLVIIGEAFEAKTQANIIFAFSLCWVVPSIAGPSLAAWIAEHWGWQWVFWSVAPIIVLGVAIGIYPLLGFERFQRSLERKPSHSPAWYFAVGTAVGTACLQIAGQLLNWASLLLVAAGVAMLIVCLPHLMPDGFASFERGLPAVVCTRGLETSAFYGCEVFMTLMLTTTHHTTLTQAGVLVTIGTCGWSLGAWLPGRSWLTLPKNVIIVVSTLIATVGVVIVTVFVWLPAAPLWLCIAGWTVTSVGVGFGHATQSLATLAFSTEADRGHNSGALQMSEGIGSIIAVGFAGTIYAALTPVLSQTAVFGWVFAVNIIFVVASTVTALRIGVVPSKNEVTKVAEVSAAGERV